MPKKTNFAETQHTLHCYQREKKNLDLDADGIFQKILPNNRLEYSAVGMSLYIKTIFLMEIGYGI